MVSKNKELTKKPVDISEESSDDESDNNEEERPTRTVTNSTNSWMSQNNASTKIPIQIKNVLNMRAINKEEETPVEADNIELITEEVMPTSLRKAMPGKEQVEAPAAPEKESYIDAEEVLSAKTNISTSIPMLLVNDESDEDDDDNNIDKMALNQAFADDDVVQAFSEEKEQNVNAENPKDINLTLPGWGSWCGNGLKVSTRKRER